MVVRLLTLFEIYGRNNCSYCDAAKALLEREGLKYVYHNIEEDPKALAEFKFIFRDAKSVPQIATGMYDSVNVIGGYEDLRAWLKRC
jgi:glutaredoxin